MSAKRFGELFSSINVKLLHLGEENKGTLRCTIRNNVHRWAQFFIIIIIICCVTLNVYEIDPFLIY